MQSITNPAMVMLLTGRSLVKKNSRRTLGVTTRGCACTNTNVMLVSYGGDLAELIKTTAHELGHALGSPHDGFDDSRRCPRGGHYLMTQYLDSKVKNEYSKCSMRAINKFLKSQKANCLFGYGYTNPPEADDELHRTRIQECQKHLKKEEKIQNIQSEGPCLFRCSASRTGGAQTVHSGLLNQDGTPCNRSNPLKKFKAGKCH